MKNSNKERWANDRKVHDLKYPDENVVRFLAHNKKYLEGKTVLDFGCGSGRHTKVMADFGLDIIAMDYNEECLDLTANKMNDYMAIKYLQNSELEVPLDNNSVDGIVAWGALFYLSRDKEEVLLKALINTLKPGGLLLADYRTKEDHLYGCGEEIEKDLYLLNDTCGSLSGITYAFRNIDELIDLYKRNGMVIENYELVNHYVENGKKCNSHYIIWARKEEY